MRRTLVTVLLAAACLSVFAVQTFSQPGTGPGPVYDATNQAYRVNVVAGGAAGGTSSSFGTAFPGTGTAAGFKDSLGSMASATIDNSGNVNVNCVVGCAGGPTFGGAFPTSGSAIGGKDANGAFASLTTTNGRLDTQPASNSFVNVAKFANDPVVTGTGASGAGIPRVTVANDSTVNAVQSGIWNVRTTSDSTLTATVTQTNAANLNATVVQGASATTTNAWPIVITDDSNVMVRPGDATNKAMRVNVVTALPTGANTIGSVNAIQSGTWTVGLASSSWVNVAKFNNDPVQTGVGNSGAGIPRVSIASDTQGNGAPNATVPSRASYIAGNGSGNLTGFLRCNNFASISTANSGNWRLVASATSQNIYVCGYTFVATGAVSVTFVEGNGAAGRFDPACNTTSVDLTGAMAVAANGGVVNPVGIAPVFTTTAGRGLCINLSAGTQVSGHVTYTQF